MIRSKVSRRARTERPTYVVAVRVRVFDVGSWRLSWSRYLPKTSVQASGVDLPIQTNTKVQKDRAF